MTHHYGSSLLHSAPSHRRTVALGKLGKGIEGGVSGRPTARFDRFVLALYWVPTYCKHDQGSAFCSPFAGPASPSAKRLALHGLWPDWGAPNGAAVTAWPQYCDGAFEYQQGGHITKKGAWKGTCFPARRWAHRTRLRRGRRTRRPGPPRVERLAQTLGTTSGRSMARALA